MRVLVLLMSLAMPVVAWFAQQEAFGPTNAEISNRYPTLLEAAGYAFSIWGLIFLLDLVYAAWQMGVARRAGGALARIRVPAAAGFALTALWMPVFAGQVFWLALAIIWGALGCLLACALILSRDRKPEPRQRLLAWMPLSLHAGWLALAAFLNTAQVIVAYQLLSTERMLGWSLGLLVLAAALLLACNARMRGNLVFAAAAAWGLAAVYVEQSASNRAGADTTAWVAVAIAVVLLAHTLWLRLRPATAGA